MKKTQLKEIKNLDIKDLKKKIYDLKAEYADLVIKKTEPGKGSKDVKLIFKKRVDLAQMLTILRQKELLVQLKPTIETDLNENKERGNV